MHLYHLLISVVVHAYVTGVGCCATVFGMELKDRVLLVRKFAVRRSLITHAWCVVI